MEQRAKRTPLDVAGGLKGLALLVAAGLTGILIGIAGFTFFYANGLAYFGHEPETCKQCHSMNEQYDAWSKGAHRNVACQECHNPHGNVVKWLASEADNGFWHSLKFTTGWYPENIKIRPHNLDIVRTNCRECHANLVGDIEQPALHANQQVDCIRCHSDVGHER